jgi:hypothetical protein
VDEPSPLRNTSSLKSNTKIPGISILSQVHHEPCVPDFPSGAQVYRFEFVKSGTEAMDRIIAAVELTARRDKTGTIHGNIISV